MELNRETLAQDLEETKQDVQSAVEHVKEEGADVIDHLKHEGKEKELEAERASADLRSQL